MAMAGQARDLLTTTTGGSVVLGTAELTATVDGVSRELVEMRSSPTVDSLADLVGVLVGPGFRARVDAVVPGEQEQRSLLYLLLDDLPGAALVSGYSLLSGDAVPPGRDDKYLDMTADLCAGWARDGSMMQLIREHGQNPTPLGPPAPRLQRDDDVLAVHELSDLPPTGMRRFRRLDVTPLDDGPLHHVGAFLRDSHVGDDGIETVVHEYSVAATVDAETRSIVRISATPDVLPWKECPAAVASASRLEGHTLADLRAHVRATFVGTSTCTHLNDVLRGLADVEVLLDHLVDHAPAVGR